MSKQSNLTQAAILLNSLPEKQAAKIVSRLDVKDVKEVLDKVRQLDAVSANELVKSFKQFEDEMAKRATLQRVDKPSTLANAPRWHVSRKRPGRDQCFDFLIDIVPELRAELLQDEHPRNVAMVLAKLPPAVAAETLANLDANTRVSVLRRLCRTEDYSSNESMKHADQLKLKLNRKLKQDQSKADGFQRAVELLSCASVEERESLLTFIGQDDPELAKALANSVFEFVDLTEMPDREIKVLLRESDVSVWAPALKFASHAIRMKLIKNMAKRPAELLSNEIARISSLDRLVAQKAQLQVVQLVLRLIRKGKIEPIRKTS